MQYKIHYPGTFPLLEIELAQDELVKAESGAMVTMDETIDVEGKLEGGFMRGLGRMLAGEKFFFQTLTASRGAGTVTLAPVAPGSLIALELGGENSAYLVQKDGFLAGEDSIEIDTQMQNLAKGLFSGAGFFVLRVHGKGTVFINSLGAIHEVNVPSGKQVIIDNDHLVAWSESLEYTIERASKSWFSSLTSGEGLVCRFNGPGKVLIQTRNPSAFAGWIGGMMPSR